MTNTAYRYRKYKREGQQKRRRKIFTSCLYFFMITLAIGLILLLVVSAYLFFPQRTNILLLGLDYTDPWNYVGRTDTIILTTFLIPDGYIGIFSVPRDLWVYIPDIGENRINTAHFFAEINKPGSGPYSTINTIENNFGIDVHYYLRIRFQGFRDIVDAMGGLDIELDRPMAGYEAGIHHLTGRKALAFARNRTGSDDFFRMERGQLLLKSIYKQLLHPNMWPKIPSVISAFSNAVDTNIPAWLWPRIGFNLLRTGIDGIDNKTLSRELTTPYITESGANILLPRWEVINPILFEMFGQ